MIWLGTWRVMISEDVSSNVERHCLQELYETRNSIRESSIVLDIE